MRFGLGPVFACERAIASRRRQTYAARSFLVAALLAAMGLVAWSVSGSLANTPNLEYADLGETYFYALIGVELALVMLVAPAATAGAICLDKARGTLAHMLATDLSDAEIVLGKLAARLAPVLALVAGSWPVMAICSLLGGIDPIALALAFTIMIVAAIFGCSLALLLSVWARRTHEVVVAVYVFWGLVLLAWPIASGLSAAGVLPAPSPWLLIADPFYLAFAPYEAPGQTRIEEYLAFFAVTLAAAAVSIALAVWRVRPVANRGGRVRRGARFGLLGRITRALPGPSLDGNPVLWREWHRLRPSMWMTALGLLVWTTTTATCAISAYWIWRHGLNTPGGPMTAEAAGLCAYTILILFGLLLLSAVAPTSMSEERQRGSLDVLAATPLSATAILLGKWWGTFRLVPFLAIGPGLVALAVAPGHFNAPGTGRVIPHFTGYAVGLRVGAAALLVATILSYGAAFNSLGLALATWIKRPSRAIAISVSTCVLLTIGGPIVLLVLGNSTAIRLSTVSPIVGAFCLGEELMGGTDGVKLALWLVGFWDAGAAAAAVGLCWLAVRTFDGAFGRIPERRSKSHWMADVVIVAAAVSGALCLVSAAASWVQGVQPQHPSRRPEDLSLLGIVLIEVLGLVLLAVVAALSAGDTRALLGAQADGSSARSSLSIVLGKWWRVFRLAFFLAVSPGLVALALATSRDSWPEITVQDTSISAPGNPGVMVSQTSPSGETTTALYPGDRSNPKFQAALRALSTRPPAPPLAARLRDAGLLILTFLAHAAAATAAGLLLGLWIKHPRPRIAAAASLPLLVAAVWPVCVYHLAGSREIERRLYALSPVWVTDHLFDPLIARQPHSAELLGWIIGWNLALLIFAIGGLYWAARIEQRRGIDQHGQIAADFNLSPAA
jgi:ABC-type transport system involved in multi-copper enzyme maturation permease subunit